MKKANKYTVFQCGEIIFKDVLNYTAPCNLDKYLRTWNATEVKSVFPHELFSSIEQVEKTTTFPAYEDFYSTLRNTNVDQGDYDQAKHLYNHHFNLPVGHPEKWSSMRDWLRHYNLLDVRPLVTAIENSFAAFTHHFYVDPYSNLSLPSLAFKAMFRMYDKNLPLSYSFGDDELRKLFRGSIVGGLTNVYHRHVNLEDDNGPRNARFAPNGNKFSYVSFWDFNSMYLWSQFQEMPTTQGVQWTKQGQTFKKSTLATDVSFGQLQWLNYLQESELCLDADNNRIQIEHAYHRGEYQVEEFRCDGYFMKDGKNFFLEYNGKTSLIYMTHETLGCYFHPGCCIDNSQIKDWRKKEQRWLEKKRLLKSLGTLIVIRDCDWKRQVHAHRHIKTSFPRILANDNEQSLLEQIKQDNVFGFAVCDVETDDALAAELSSDGFLFPPIISRQDIDERFLSPHMKARHIEENEKMRKSTVIQV